MERIELLTVTDCPHRELMLARLRQALDRVGAPDVRMTERVIDDPEAARAAGMYGSPTVLVDGRDPFTVPGTEPSVSCRLYSTAAGFDGAPSVDELVDAVSDLTSDPSWATPRPRSPARGVGSRGRGPLRRAVPILPTTDIDRALAHYAALGFDTEAWEGGGYGFVVRDGVEVHLSQVDDGSGRAADSVTWYLHVHDADALHSEWAASAVAGELVAPVDTAWGKCEGSHTDPDGNTVRFGSSRVRQQEDLDGW